MRRPFATACSLPSRPSLALAILGLLLLSFGTGCGAIAAAANPKVAWAFKDPAPMSVVVRRADAAEKTVKEVDRLLAATPINKDSEWVQKVGPAPEDAATEMKALGQISFYAESRARIVPSEVWVRTLPTLKSTKGKFPSILAAIDPDLDDKYQKIMAKKQEIAGIRTLVAAEEAATDGDKKEHQKKIDDLKQMADKSEKEVEPLQRDLVGAAKASSGKAAPEVRNQVGAALVNLRQAIDDAGIANGAAAVRYPMATPTILSSLKAMVPFIVADIIQEKTGKRPNMNKLSPDVSLDGTSVKLTLNGLEPSDIGKLKIADVVTESISRSEKWVEHVVTLLGAISANNDMLAFEGELLDGLIDGFTTGGWKAIVAAKIPGQDDAGGGSSTVGALASKVSDGKVDTTSLTSAKGLKGLAKKTVTDAAANATKTAKKETTKAATQAVNKTAGNATASATKSLGGAFGH